jgi:hypothetical protein
VWVITEYGLWQRSFAVDNGKVWVMGYHKSSKETFSMVSDVTHLKSPSDINLGKANDNQETDWGILTATTTTSRPGVPAGIWVINLASFHMDDHRNTNKLFRTASDAWYIQSFPGFSQ